jgi:transcriptional regulator with XRE-family HTH domain
VNRPDGERELAAALRRLKERGGLSYQELGQRVFISSSTLHRYCTGKGVPGDYDIVVRLARECRAEPTELNDLLRYWEAATGEGPGSRSGGRSGGKPGERREEGDGSGPDSLAVASVPSVASAVSAAPGTFRPGASGACSVRPGRASGAGMFGAGTFGPGRRTRRRPRIVRLFLAVALALVVLGAAVASVPAGRGAEGRVASGAEGGAEGLASGTEGAVPVPAGAESWSQAPLPVDPELFGMTMNSFSGVMPSFRVGAVRLWDSETRWSQVEPERGRFDWSTLDRLLDGAERRGLPTVFVFGGTPPWAAPNGRKAAYREDTRAAPPDDLADWDTFVRAVVRHAGDRIDAYETWITANHDHHYNGSAQTLVDMTRRASRIIREEDRGATVVCPSITDLWERKAHAYLLRFAELGAYQYCDAAAVNLYQRRVTDPPETMLETVQDLERTFQLAGYHLPLWRTGTTQTLQLNDPLDADRAANYLVRFYLMSLYSRRVERMFYYAWGNSKIPLVVQAEGQPPTKAGRYVGRLQRWLARAEIRSCGHGGEIGLPENVWQCEFLVPDEHGTERPARIRWTLSGTADARAGTGARRVQYLDGTARALGARDTVRITERPLLIQYD